MSESFVGEIRMFAGNFAPAGWQFCDGSLLPISENETLFALIGTTYGGDGVTTFAVPDLRGRLPIHQGGGVVLAQTGGAEQVTVTVNQLATHSHPLSASGNVGSQSDPTGRLLSESPNIKIYSAQVPAGVMAPGAITPAGGSQPHENMQPYLCVSFIISLFGIFPSQT